MRTTIGYGLMFVSLGSVLTYTLVNADELANPFTTPRVLMWGPAKTHTPLIVEAPIAANESSAEPVPAQPHETTITAAPAAPASTEAQTPAANTPDQPTITPGMSAAEVTEALGQPDAISADGSRWTYASTVLIFNSEQRLNGAVGFDPVQAAINKYDHVIASIAPDEADAPAPRKSRSAGPRILSRSKSSYASDSNSHWGSRHRPLLAASSRDAYRYNGMGAEYSYYMNRYGPRDRMFVRKPSLPRGMSNIYLGNVSRSYQGLGGRSGYSMGPAYQYRR
jgi:hypothetical protein